MPALKYLIGLMLLLVTATPSVAQQRTSERRTWNVVRRGAKSEMKQEAAVPAATEHADAETDPQVLADPAEVDVAPAQYADQLAEPILDDGGVVYADDLYHGDQGACDAGCCDVGCGDGCCDSIGLGIKRPGYWVRGEYLYWQLQGARIPELITTSTAGTAQSDAGVLGLASTTVLLGNERIGDEGRSGGRIEVGGWIDSRYGISWQAGYFGLAEANDRWRFAGTEIPILGRPFFSVEPGEVGPNADLIAFPNEVEGNATVAASTFFEGAEALLRYALINDRCRRLHLIAGYQYLGLDDDLSIDDFKTITGPSTGLVIGTTLDGRDRFESGKRISWWCNRLHWRLSEPSMDARWRVATSAGQHEHSRSHRRVDDFNGAAGRRWQRRRDNFRRVVGTALQHWPVRR